MKKLFKILFVISLLNAQYSFVNAQNLVPNPSFEDYSSCPNDWYQMNKVNNWLSYKGSPDFFTFCGTLDSFATPNNLIGNQNPASGSSYLGAIFFSKNNLDADEMIGTNLLQPLIIGVKYYVSFKLVLKYDNDFWVCCANNKIGARFTSQTFSIPNPPLVNSNPPIVNNEAHIYSDSIIRDTLNWTRVFSSFIADSSYNQIIIGNFFDSLNIDIEDIQPSYGFSYYFIDDVCVSTDSSFASNYFYTGIMEESFDGNFYIYPNPFSEYLQIKQEFMEPYSLKIFDMIGQLLYEEENITSISKIINSSQFSNGMLIINIEMQNRNHNYKLIKQ